MTTVLRVRRKRTTDPLETIVLPLKRTKTDSVAGVAGGQASARASANSPGETEKTVFTFAGTVEKKTQPISVHIQSALRRAKIGLSPKKPVKATTASNRVKREAKKTGAREKSRSSRQSGSQSRRFKLVQRHRGIQLHELDQDADKYKSALSGNKTVANGSSASRGSALQTDTDKLFNFFDVEQSEQLRTARKNSPKGSKNKPDDITVNSVKMLREKLTLEDQSLPDSEYVYDLYYADSSDLDWTVSGTSVGMTRTGGDELVYEYFNDSGDFNYDDEDDENDEGNWRNDYPDEDGDDSRNPDMFDEYQDDYRYGEGSSSDEDIVDEYSTYRHRKIKYVDPEDGGFSGSDSDIDNY